MFQTLSNFNSETWLESLQSLHTRCVQGVQRLSKNSWAVVSRNYLNFRKKYTSTLVTHREFLIGVCWPVGCFQLCLPWFSKASTAWAAEMLSQLSLPSSEQELKDGPHMLKMDRTVLPETRKRRATVHVCSAGKWGGKTSRRLRFRRPLEHFKQRVWAFIKWCQSFYTNVNL